MREISGEEKIGTKKHPDAFVHWKYQGGPKEGWKRHSYWFQVYCGVNELGLFGGGILPFPWQEQGVMKRHLTGAGQESVDEVIRDAKALLDKTEKGWETYLSKKQA